MSESVTTISESLGLEKSTVVLNRDHPHSLLPSTTLLLESLEDKRPSRWNPYDPEDENSHLFISPGGRFFAKLKPELNKKIQLNLEQTYLEV
jgi:hypothetical protein